MLSWQEVFQPWPSLLVRCGLYGNTFRIEPSDHASIIAILGKEVVLAG